MTAEEIRRMEERVAQVRAEMERACRAAGRAPGEVLLCAASKTQNSETVRAAAALDIDLFGENRVQELCEKYAAGAYSGKPLHFIGHLQTNKVRQVVGRACMIESVGSHRLLECVAAKLKQGIRQDILVEINIGAEASKAASRPKSCPASGMRPCFALRVRGLMSIRLLRMRRARAAPTCTDARPVRAAQAAQGGNGAWSTFPWA
ncbi:MAG: YggS family pyridoxal phosphate-dependent enzyme [Ruthenibacterium lactatiformans]